MNTNITMKLLSHLFLSLKLTAFLILPQDELTALHFGIQHFRAAQPLAVGTHSNPSAPPPGAT